VSLKDLPHVQDSTPIYDVYCEAIARKARERPGLVGASIDRKCNRRFVEEHRRPDLCGAICFVCARRKILYANDVKSCTKCNGVPGKCEAAGCRRGLIRMLPALRGDKFLRMNKEMTECKLGRQTYMEAHAAVDSLSTPAAKEDLKHWTAMIPFPDGDVCIMCCPEDRECEESHDEDEEGCVSLCDKCFVPVCRDCEQEVVDECNKRSVPKFAVSNDLYFGYVPEFIYKEKVTYMEMLCASLFNPTMLSMQVDIYGFDSQAKLNQRVHDPANRTGGSRSCI
jgi:hypothetical protein